MAQHRYFEIYTGTKTYVTPAGTLATPDWVLETYPATAHVAHIIETDMSGEMIFAIQNLAAERSRFNVDPAIGNEEAVAAITQAYFEQDNAVPGPTPEERIAAMLEFQAMMAMPDEEA